MIEGEEWRSIAGYEGYYEVSNLGRVRSLKRTITNAYGVKVKIRPRILRQTLSGPGKKRKKKDRYKSVGLHKDGVGRTFKVHRLVAEAFIPNPDNLPEIDHIDANKKNNRVDNLRWCTHQQNMQYMVEMGLYRGSYKEMLKPEVREKLLPKLRKRVIRDDGVEFESITSAAKALGRTRNAVGMVVNHPTRKCNGHSFRFAD